MLRSILVFLFFLFFIDFGLAQKPAGTFEEYEKAYQKRIKSELIYGVYIPRDLGDAFISLNKLIDADTRNQFKNAPEALAAKKLHFSFGKWMIYNWSFYEGSRLSHYLKELGVYHPDDMAQFLIITYHRNLNREKLNVKELVDFFAEKHKREKEERLKKGRVIEKGVLKKGDKEKQ